jgi:hypothetical protein
MPYRGFPENGLVAFYDHPRYTTGYASLFAIPGFTTEAHMFKTYSNRVKATRLFVESCAWRLADHHKTIAKLKREARKQIQQKTEFVIRRTLDTTQYRTITFKGFLKTDSISPVTGLPTFRFDQNSSWEKEIPYYDHYKTTKLIEAPDFYIIPSAWQEVTDRLRLNGVEMMPLEKDTTLFVEYYRIGEFETYPNPYNGHYKHYNTRVESFRDSIPFLEGDLMVPMNQISNQYIVEVLEPEADDSFFNWNFFDSILSRKEYFSSYVFDTLAVRLLENDPKLKDSFKQKQKEDAGFASSHRQQLGYIYENSPYSEKTYRRYPVMRFFNAVSE